MKVSDFNYELPEELIAQHPLKKRDASRLMVLDKNRRTIEHKVFRDIINYLNKGDCLVINNTKVIPARLYGKKTTGTDVEFLLLKNLGDDNWEVMVRPGRRLKPGDVVNFGMNYVGESQCVGPEGHTGPSLQQSLLTGEILEIMDNGNRKVKFTYSGIFNEILDQIGLMPVPPYIKEILKDNNRYQTVYAKHEGSAAAPTAGFHFTEELLEEIKAKGVEIANVTLHVGIGTFRPVKTDEVEEHDMHSEHFYIKQEDSIKINKAKKEGHKIIACGTTSCRVLESIADEGGMVKEIEGDTSIFIYPGYKFKCIDNLITNFHLPESTLIMLVSALAGKDFIMEAYKEAVTEKYRFFSFGDAMFIM
ncbi:MAG: tRNA preQ1(34) S-adenosylmethionine ribosyltransferase-isomerase QueA [Firmicutes bacterium]|nr:tRNA preQ1(34) S-adenosylmethionine ribosyltransferase-isomerase QueA [Bacillota bacterium]